MTRLFVYGTLRDPSRLAHVLGYGLGPKSPDAIANRVIDPLCEVGGWRIVERYGLPTLERGDEYDVIEGTLLEVDERDLGMLDRYERVGSLYFVDTVNVNGAPAMVYRMLPVLPVDDPVVSW